MRNRYPAAPAIGVQLNSTSFDFSPSVTKMGIMFAGVIGVGGPISLPFSIAFDVVWKLTFSQFESRTTSPLRSIAPLPFLTRISCWSERGSLRTWAEESGARDAFAPATLTCDLEPCE